MLGKLSTEDIAGVASPLLGIGIVISRTPVVAADLAFVVAKLSLVAGGLTEGAIKMFGMT